MLQPPQRRDATRNGRNGGAGAQAIELRLNTAAQLFHTLDPSPFRDGDLDAVAEQYIVGWARELPAGASIAIVVHLPEREASRPGAATLPDSIRHFFGVRAQAEADELRELFRFGRKALAIGLAILATCLLLAVQVSDGLGERTASRVVQESLVILGWVAIWRPAEIFLYDWLPLARRRDLFRRLARAEVAVRATPAAA
ncbi:hypothetical protein [Falsiroseomonas oryzae]|uniref:hypothetical protein n=1 Tax=Falsiroseomonas oryzae TaxID=2766473 RepID=UPI0022EAF2D6|nr:hypothetical protein [Roseomonas sp. MO-31]